VLTERYYKNQDFKILKTSREKNIFPLDFMYHHAIMRKMEKERYTQISVRIKRRSKKRRKR